MITRSLFAAALATLSAVAAPPLTTVQDVLYKADGSRFNGIVTISWTSFEAMDRSAIATQSTTVKVINGVLNVQLVPTTSSTPAIYYKATYNSEGRVQFEETWSVPSSGTPVRLRDIRVLTNDLVDSSTTADDLVTKTIAESDVLGLVADLDARPMKGPGYIAKRVAVVNSSGTLDGATGLAADCVHVDGSSGPCGGVPPSFVDMDTPAGVVDGSNQMFALTSLPDPPSSLTVYRNGILLKTGVDYSVSSRTLTFFSYATPQPGDVLSASYRLSGTAASASTPYPAVQVLCGGTGAATASVVISSLATCQIPAGLLLAGDRVEVQYDLEHQGTAGGFSFELLWGGASVTQRDASAAETLVTGRGSATIKSSGAQISHQSWGTNLPFATGMLSAADAWTNGIKLDFRGKAAVAGDTVTLRGYTVLRIP
jgi:hypothetical protein